MKLINYEPEEIWEIFQNQKGYLKTHLKTLAENPDCGVRIYMTAEERGTTYLPSFAVYVDDDEFYTEAAVNERDCEQTVKKLYFEYLDEARLIDHLIKEHEEEQELTLDDMEQVIGEREEELDAAIDELLNVFLNSDLEMIVHKDEADDIREMLKDHVCEWLYQECRLSVNRPMFLEDENGDEFYEEFPYDCMEFDND